jgi:hypothetical protein
MTLNQTNNSNNNTWNNNEQGNYEKNHIFRIKVLNERNQTNQETQDNKKDVIHDFIIWLFCEIDEYKTKLFHSTIHGENKKVKRKND